MLIMWYYLRIAEDVFKKCVENEEGEANNQVFQHLNLHHRSDVTARSCPRIGGAEAEQDGCVLGSGELREKWRKESQI